MYDIYHITKEPADFIDEISKQLDKDMGGQEDDPQ